MIRLFVIFSLLATLAHAQSQQYRLDTARSTVQFSYALNQAQNTGTMPVKSADMRIDLDNIAASKVSVTLNARAARAGIVFVTQTMKGPDVLDTNRFPEIRFRSTAISGALNNAKVSGLLTIRGMTRPVTLTASLYRQRGTLQGDRSNLTILLKGAVSRSAFGAGGYPGFVGNMIGLNIIARIEK